MATRAKVGLAFFAIFLLGFAAGALSLSAYQRRVDPTRQPIWTVKFNRERYVLELTESVGFRPEQMSALNTILDETREEFLALRRRLRPQFEGVKVRARLRIREMLTADQQPRFEAFLKQWDEERRAEEEAASQLKASERKP
jgi:hypothetical protein